jgi:hypothetical protein
MVICNRTVSNNISDCVFWYKADLHEKPFKVGTPGLWKYHYQNYNDKYKEEQEEEELRQAQNKKYGKGKKSTTFVVNKVY